METWTVLGAATWERTNLPLREPERCRNSLMGTCSVIISYYNLLTIKFLGKTTAWISPFLSDSCHWVGFLRIRISRGNCIINWHKTQEKYKHNTKRKNGQKYIYLWIMKKIWYVTIQVTYKFVWGHRTLFPRYVVRRISIFLSSKKAK